jgi:hypothetical protein
VSAAMAKSGNGIETFRDRHGEGNWNKCMELTATYTGRHDIMTGMNKSSASRLFPLFGSTVNPTTVETREIWCIQ